MDDPKQDLDDLIKAFLERRTSFFEFQSNYSRRYADENADAGFTPAEIDYYGLVHERAEWTSSTPTAEDRSFGWKDVEQFRDWLQSHARIRASDRM